MKFAVNAWSNGRARAGVLQLGSCPYPIETPAFLLTTRKGLLAFVSPDLLSTLPSPDSHLFEFSPLHLKDTSPIVESCNCFTCQNHTKAYMNHLFNVHEMLAQTLLEIHNTHHYLGFFRSIREAIKEGKFEQFRKVFVASRRDHLFTVALSA